MEKEIKVPQQERGIQKRQLIVETGFQLFAKQGYYHTNTAEIAKAAGVSTGIVYRYFPDKKAIFIEGLNNLNNLCNRKIKQVLDTCSNFDNLEATLGNLINQVVEAHFWGKEMHEEINSMVHSDPDIAAIYYNWEDEITQIVADAFPRLELELDHSHEKIHMIIHMIENYCHEIVFHKHHEMDYDAMKQIIIKAIIFTMK